MTIHDIVMAQIHHEETEFVPYDFRVEAETADRLTEYYGSDAWKANLITPFDYAPSFFDSWDVMTLINPDDPTKKRDAFGCLWTQTPRIAHLDRCAMYNCDPRDYKWPTLDDFYWPGREEQLKQWDKNHPRDKFSIANFGAGYWEHMWRLMTIEDALLLTIEEPDTFDYILDRLDELFHQFLDIIVQTSADAVLISDDWCDQRSCMIGPDRWRKHLKPRLARLYKKIHDHGMIAINHVCGCVTPLMDDLVEIGLDVLESVQAEAMDPYENKKRYGDRIAFYGGLGVQQLTSFGTPQEVREEVRRLRREMSRGGGYILSSAKPLNYSHPTGNVVAVYETMIEENGKFR